MSGLLAMKKTVCRNFGNSAKTSELTLIKAGVIFLVTVKADLSRIPERDLRKEMGSDGREYYVIHYEVEITYYSAYTKYELIYNDANYGLIATEYV